MADTKRTSVKLVLADVDGTLVTKDKVLTRRAVAAVRALHDRDIRFAVTSGRPPRGMAMLVEPLRLDGVIAGFNGGAYVNPDLSVVESKTLPEDVARRALEMILERKLDAWVYTADEWLLRDMDAPHREREEWTVKFPPRVVKDFEEAIGKAAKIVGVSDDLDRVARAEKDLQGELGGKASAARSQPYYLDVTHPQANKGEVVRFLSQRFDVPAGSIMTLGDMPNDTSMFKVSGSSVAMGQSSDEVKKAATYVTDSYEDEGFAKAIERYVLGEG